MSLPRFSMGPRIGIAIGAALLAVPVACSLIVSTSTDQCTSDNECASFGAGHTCNADHLCVKGNGTGNCSGFNANADASCACSPTDNTSIINGCTGNPCTPFDNAGRVTGWAQGFGAGKIPALVAPPPDDTG